MGQEENDAAAISSAFSSVKDLLRQVQRAEITQFLMTNPNDSSSCYLEIHAGAGGTESQDWADMVRRMYVRWAQQHDSQDFQVHLISEIKGERAGVKSVALQIDGPFAYGFLKTEMGVHRLVRNSPFDAQNKRHTSFCSVSAVPLLQERDDRPEVEFDPKHLRIETMRASGAGGQHVNKTDSAVRLTHLPTGIVVYVRKSFFFPLPFLF